MHPDLIHVFDRLIEAVKKDSRFLGGWHFGSVGRGLQDEYSDFDPVFLVDDTHFDDVIQDIPNLFQAVCDEVLIIWPEEFNSPSLCNYGIILEENNSLFQFDIFTMNAQKTEEPFCKMHYEGCTLDQLIFDKEGSAQALLSQVQAGAIHQRDVLGLIDKYWIHLHMCVKYILRQDLFKLMNVLQTLLHVHTELLLADYQQTAWGGWPSQVKMDVPQNKQVHLLSYYCTADITELRTAIYRCMEFFVSDAKEACQHKGLVYPEHTEAKVTGYFKKHVC